MSRVFLLSIGISLFCTLFLFWNLYRWRGFRVWQLAPLVPALLLCFWYPLGGPLEDHKFWKDALSWSGNVWSVVSAFFTGSVILLEVLRGLFWLYTKSVSGHGKDALPPRRSVPLALVMMLALTGYSAWEAQQLRVTRLTVQTDKLPEGQNYYRVAFVADIHLNELTGERTLERIVDLIREQDADLLLFGGDVVDYYDMSGRGREANLLSRAMPPHGSVAVLGNHEAIQDHYNNAIPFMKRAWMYVMRGEAIMAGPVTIVGVDDPKVAEAQGSIVHDPMIILEQIPQDRFTILLKHQPDIQPESVGLFDLQLSGHTHGGQIWPARHLVELAYRAPQGRLARLQSEKGQSWYYCTFGTGFSRLPLRFLTPPEIVVVDIIR